MSLPDGAEYWWAVKSASRKRVFTHAKGLKCGHHHINETYCIKDIDCFACKKVMAEMPEIKNEIEQRHFKKTYPFGKCECGGMFKLRKNQLTDQPFLGCSNFPKCTKSKKL